MNKYRFLLAILLSGFLISGCGSNNTTTGDTTAPVITIVGDNPVTIEQNETYTDEGATAEDETDGTVAVVKTGDVDTSNAGTYTITYTATDAAGNTATATRTVIVEPLQPPTTEITGTKLACDSIDTASSADASDYNASQPVKRNVSSNSTNDTNRENPTAHNVPKRLSVVVDAKTASGDAIADLRVHPLTVTYLQQIVGDYEMGDGSADIGDPTHVDGVFFALSLDNGDTWKNYTVSDSTGKSSIQVTWDSATINYPGHAQKPKAAVYGNRIMLAWHDKYCPSGNPLDLEDVDGTYPSDYFSVNGNQKFVDYEGVVAPNGKTVYQVPFSCIWTARGVFDTESGDIVWHAPMQLTTGKRDSNHIWIEASDAGFAMSWQEDNEGLRAGKGAGPGEGWSGATTNHGTDIWYSSLKMEDFDATDGTVDTKPKSLNNFHYPVRITDNEGCSLNDTKPYCQYLCDTYGYETLDSTNNSDETITRCKTFDTDMLDDTQVVLNADTGASRSALKILKTDAGENIVILGYEETKGLSVSEPGVPDQDQGTEDTNISAEGKSVYFESFKFEAIDDFNGSKLSTIQDVAMPLVSAGNIVNIKVPEEDNPSSMIYENARRLVIGTQIDSCDAEQFTFAFMYKQSFETQGASSDMFIRTNNGFTYDSFVPLDGREVTNISAQENYVTLETPSDYNVSWSEDNLDDNTYDNGNENTFSPRIFLRGNNIYTGFEYTPDDNKTQQENMPSNFHTHLYIDGVWQGPKNVTQVTKSDVTTVDARFFTTPKGTFDKTGLESDKSNPNVLFITWGTVEGIGDERAEADLYYKRSTDNGMTWDENETKLAAIDGTVIEEKEVESFATPDGKTFFNFWLQETETPALQDDSDSDRLYGLDTWFGRVDYNITK